MKSCTFCNLDRSLTINTMIEETKNFCVLPGVGSFVEGYLLIVSKRHILAMAELNKKEKQEYLEIIKKYRNVFFEKYQQYPIIFEHGSPIREEHGANSIAHAHTHIMNHHYKEEEDLIRDLKFVPMEKLEIDKKKNYIFYLSPTGIPYITYNFGKMKQVMRFYIAKDLKMEDKYNWRQYPFMDNLIKTIERFKEK